MPDDQGAAIVGQAVEDAAERGAEPLRVLGDELRVGLAQCLERAASRFLVRGAPAVLDRRPQARLDHHARRHLLVERGEEAGERLRRALCTGRYCEVIAAAEAAADLQRCRYACGSEDVSVGVGVAPELDLLATRATLPACSPALALSGPCAVEDQTRAWWLTRLSDREIAEAKEAMFGEADRERIARERERLAAKRPPIP